MPNYKGHLAGGAVTFCCLRLLLHGLSPSLLTSCEWLGFTLFGALFPDIDTKSKGQKIFYRLIFVLCFALIIQKMFAATAVVSFLGLVPLMVKHRGITHSLYFLLFICAVVLVLAKIIIPSYFNIVAFDTFFFFSGAFSHLFLDLGLRKIIYSH